MSQMEYNKGKLIPTGRTTENMSGEEFDEVCENYDLAIVDNLIYKVEWEANGEDLYELARAVKNEDGSIDFETYHYNGGGHWTEVVESALKNGS